MLDPTIRARLRALLAEATPGPWRVSRDFRQERNGRKYGVGIFTTVPVDQRRRWEDQGDVQIAEIWHPENPIRFTEPEEYRAAVEAVRTANAALIAEGINALSILLDALDQAEGERDWMRQERDDEKAEHDVTREQLAAVTDSLGYTSDAWRAAQAKCDVIMEQGEAIARERDTLQARVTALEQWIRDNGLHTQSCGNFGRQPCTCGLDAARAGRG